MKKLLLLLALTGLVGTSFAQQEPRRDTPRTKKEKRDLPRSEPKKDSLNRKK